ncbi:MAG: hypothetical protein AABO58_24295 [Acidobacteriota bacterium]
MKKSLVLTLLAIAAVAVLASGCKKEENVNTDTAVVDTGVTTTDTMGTLSTTDTTVTSATTDTTMTSTTSMTGTTGTTKTY